MITDDIQLLQNALKRLERQQPLLLNITNMVTMQWVANTQLAIHAAPIMSNCADEIPEILSACQALYINIGTLEKSFINIAIEAAQVAKKLNIPIILDPVGCGFTQLRTEAAKQLLPFATIIRANASEMMALNANTHTTKGVESTQTTANAIDDALALAKTFDCTCVISGKQDYIISANEKTSSTFGSLLMTQITGMGCALGGVIAAFSAILPDPFQAAKLAVLFYTLCASSIQQTTSLGNFQHDFINALNQPDWHKISQLMEP